MSPWTCVVCGTALKWRTGRPSEPHPVCHAVPCRMVVAQGEAMSAEAFARHLATQTKQVRQQRALVRQHAQAIQAKIDTEAQEHEAHYAALSAKTADYPPERFVHLTLHSGPRQDSPLPRRRRRLYRAHLKSIIAEALLTADEPAQVSPLPLEPEEAMTATEQNLCALCAGGCCNSGSELAYLKPATMRRFMASQPQLSPRQVMAAYMARLSPQTQTGSCVNHTATGCSLPREMRSDTCNRYVCTAQSDLHAALRATPPALGAVAIVRRQDHWNRDTLNVPNEVIAMAAVTESGITPLAPWSENS
ncbi:MAG: hypothetical protein EOP38_22800 [Rubrivivax sp.]|nr:MAG: hypothetical protein EOP38_22800 [Rubrivivax sp.]